MEPMTLEEAKEHLRVDFEDEDALIGAILKAARKWVEGHLNRSMLTQTWQIVLDNLPDQIKIPKPPLQSASIVIKDDAGNLINMDLADYVVDVDSDPGRIVVLNQPSISLHKVNPVKITFVAGFTSLDQIPETWKQAIKLLVGHWYENREAVSQQTFREVPMAVKSLLAHDRIILV